MFSSSDIRNVEFETDKKGYIVEDVRAFLSQIADQIDALMADRLNYENRVNSIAVQMEDYRKDEETLKNALIAAQKMSDTMIREARQKADSIIEEAKLDAERISSKAVEQAEESKQTLKLMKKEITSFRREMLAMYNSHINAIGLVPEFDEAGKLIAGSLSKDYTDEPEAAKPEPIVETVSEGAASEAEPEKSTQIEQPASEVEPSPVKAENKPETPEVSAVEPDLDFSVFKLEPNKPTSRFGQLDFGGHN